ncbi:sigma-70 family RNA polymerase sigma factor [Palleronia sp. LCG004]|uniref:sigma-70 family RNA polymerase sigma factor n=1 Tax=Palleronia sp. LCG004 TaxID=3079304 RepID=UPI002941C64C|nr:sigma-70 family RNA polymerase sigma factor [Palleronia sp. LCG004]WOI55306.1 sigma-70 family RNA polymerase sigma factor [Palleronia sp. LCG004]
MARDVADIERMILRIADSDRDAFLALYDATSAKLFGVCLRVLKDRSDAEDVLQEVFVKVWRNAGRYNVNGLSPMTWLVTIARNAAIDRLRTRKTQTEDAEVLERLPDRGPSPEGAAIAASEARRIAACLDELERDRAQAVRGAYLDGLSYQDLATKFDVPLNTMRTWLRRSLQRLKDCLSA